MLTNSHTNSQGRGDNRCHLSATQGTLRRAHVRMLRVAHFADGVCKHCMLIAILWHNRTRGVRLMCVLATAKLELTQVVCRICHAHLTQLRRNVSRAFRSMVACIYRNHENIACCLYASIAAKLTEHRMLDRHSWLNSHTASRVGSRMPLHTHVQITV